MSYYVGVNLSNSVNSTIVTHTMKTMNEIQTFFGPIQYFSNGTNKYPLIFPAQFINGKAEVLGTTKLIYPAPFKPASGMCIWLFLS